MKKNIESIELNTEANVTSVALELENNLVEVLNTHAPEKIQTIISSPVVCLCHGFMSVVDRAP